MSHYGDPWSWNAEMYGWRDMPEPHPAPEGVTWRWRDRDGSPVLGLTMETRAPDGRLFRSMRLVSREFAMEPYFAKMIVDAHNHEMATTPRET